MLHAHMVGKRGEDLAVEYLIQQGYHLVDRNIRRRGGEMDAVLRRGREWVFVEVKTRSAGNESSAPQDIHPAQVRRLAKHVESYVVRRGIERWRLILLCVTLSRGTAKIEAVDLTEGLEIG